MARTPWNPNDLMLMGRRSLAEKMLVASLTATSAELDVYRSVYFRQLTSTAATSAAIHDPEGNGSRAVRMFGSNNYLGLATDPRVVEAACAAVIKYGIGVGGSSFLNGYSPLQRELEEATAYLKGAEDCIVFSSGFLANTSWTSALVRPVDTVICDSEAHMSFREGVRGKGAAVRTFRHNSVPDLENFISAAAGGDKFVFIEGLYSMHGDVPDIESIYRVTKRYGGMLVIDDAHGTGTLGPTGRGAAERLERGADLLSVGTFSKALGANGGFICGSRDLINCLRVLSPGYIFSTAPSPAVLAGALKAVQILIEEPQRVERLRKNAQLVNQKLRRFDNVSDEISPITFLRSGGRFNVLEATKRLEEMGCFVNAVSFPAVAPVDSGIRISVSSEHTEDDIAYLESCVEAVWAA